MSYEDKIIDFLAQPENLSVALEVADYVQKLREQTHRKFWSEFSEVVTDRLEGSEYSDHWVFERLPDNNWEKNYGICSLRPTLQRRSNSPLLGVSMQQGSSSNYYRLLMGIQWSQEPTEEIKLPSLEKLILQLEAMNMKQSSKRWPRWNWLQYRIRGEKFLSSFNRDPEAFVNEVVDTYWQFFIQVQPLVAAVNLDLGAEQVEEIG
jgi:hypothetical protein